MTYWQMARISRLKRSAAEIGQNITLMVAYRDKHQDGPVLELGPDLAYLRPHLADPALCQQRLAVYEPTPGDEYCPACWIKHGVQAPLSHESIYDRVDMISCKGCDYTEFVPNASGAPDCFTSDILPT